MRGLTRLTLRYATSWNENFVRHEHFRVACTMKPSAGICFNSSNFKHSTVLNTGLTVTTALLSNKTASICKYICVNDRL